MIEFWYILFNIKIILFVLNLLLIKEKKKMKGEGGWGRRGGGEGFWKKVVVMKFSNEIKYCRRYWVLLLI